MNTRLIVVLLLLLTVFMSFSVSSAQDEDTSTEPAGVGEVAKAADNFNVPAVPAPQQAQAAVTTPPLVELTITEEEFQKQDKRETQFNHYMRNIWSECTCVYRSQMSHKMPHSVIVKKQTGSILWEFVDDEYGILSVYDDYSVTAADLDGAEFFQGSLA